jgi:peptidyl-prolyl cis-trans isomerase SurA
LNLRRAVIAGFLAAALAPAVIVDRVAIVVVNRAIKDSDIAREVRLIDFLNGDPLEFSATARKSAAGRLIDQALLRREIETAQYPEASEQRAREFLAQVRRQRYPGEAAFQAALARYGITEPQLLAHLRWQLTVLDFVDQRFRLGVTVSEAEARQYYQAHAARFQQAGKPSTFEGSRPRIESELAGQRVNSAFYAWLDEARKRNRVEYHEEELK